MEVSVRQILLSEEIRGERRANSVRQFLVAVFFVLFIGFFMKSEENHNTALVVLAASSLLLLYSLALRHFLGQGRHRSFLKYLSAAIDNTWITVTALARVIWNDDLEPEGWVAYITVLLVLISVSGLRFSPGLCFFSGALAAVELSLLNLHIALANGQGLPPGHLAVVAVLLLAAGVAAALTTLTARQLIFRTGEAERQRTQLAFEVDQAKRLALTDDLTGLYNRRHFLSEIERELARSARNRKPFTVLIIDVDHFKQVNDTFGHLAGDLAMKQVADVLRENSRAVDVVARYGGDEFALILCEADASQADVAAQRLCKVVREYEFEAGTGAPHFHGSLSIGLACFPDDATDVVGLLKAADRALYQAKAGGRDRVVHARDLETASPLS